MKRILSIILVTVLVMNLSFTVLAANNGLSQANAIVFTEESFSSFGSYQATLKKGETLWYCFENTSLVDDGIVSQVLNCSCSYEYTVNVDSTQYIADEAGFVSVRVEDTDRDGKYYFSITNNSTRKISVFVSLENLKEYERTYISLNVGDNNITVNTQVPTNIYDFCPAEVGAEAGLYKFTVKDMSGNVIDDALLGNWGSIGAPSDLTGDEKTNTITWGTTEVNATFLLGVSNVTEDFVISVERVGDYDDGIQHIEYLDYTNVHTPAQFTMPQGNLVKVDITKEHILVLDANGIYHLNSVDGPVVYVDLTSEAIDLKNAYGAYGANVLRLVYTNEDGVQCAYDMINSMKSYADAMDGEGYYPLTEDLKIFFMYYGAAQKWYEAEYSPLSNIASGAFIPESAWLATAYYMNTTGDTGSADNGSGNSGADNGGASSDKIPGNSTPGSGNITDGTANDAVNGGAEENGVTDKAPVTSPQTGDNMITVIVIAIVALAACSVVLFVRKREFK